MAPEYGATIGYFPIDQRTLDFLHLTGREKSHINMVEKYLKEQNLFVHHNKDDKDPLYSGEVMELNLSTVQPSLSGPKRPHDRVNMQNLKSDFVHSLTNKIGFKGYGLTDDQTKTKAKFSYLGKDYELTHGSVVIAAITSCTNTSNPDVMLAAGLLARNAVKRGLTVAPYIKTSLSPGSGVVSEYFLNADVT